MHVAPRWIPWLLAACLASAAHALPAVQARFTLGFAFPPNPCVETSFLHGEARLRVGDPAAGGSVPSAALTAPLACRQAGPVSLLLPAVPGGTAEIGVAGACKGADEDDHGGV